MKKTRVMAFSMAALMTTTSLTGSAFALEGLKRGEESKIPFNALADVKVASAGALETIAEAAITGVEYVYDKESQYIEIKFNGDLDKFGFAESSAGDVVSQWYDSPKFKVGAGSVEPGKTYYFYAKKGDGGQQKKSPDSKEIKAINSITVNTASNVEATIGDTELKLDGITFQAKDSGGQNIDGAMPVAKELVTMPDMQSEGSRSATVTIAGKQGQFNVNIKKPVVSEVQINSVSNEYTKDGRNVVVNTNIAAKQYGYATTNDNSQATWGNSNKFSNLATGKYYFFVKDNNDNISEGKEFEVKAVDSIEITPPRKIKYTVGDKLDLVGSEIKVYSRVDDSKKELMDTIVTKEDYLDYKTDNAGKHTVSVTVAGKKTAFDIEVEDKITSIEVKGVTTDYKRKQRFDGRGYIIATYELNGKKQTKEIKLDEGMLSGFNTDRSGRHTVTVRYQDCTTKYDIYVEELEDDVEIIIDGRDYGLSRETYYYADGNYFKLPRDIKSSRYELIGFTEDRNWDGGEYYEPGEEVKATEDTTYYMICKDVDREYVVYIDNDPDEKRKEDKDKVYIVRKNKDFEFKKHGVPKGYTLVGFSREKNGKDKIYEVGDTVEVNKDITYYVIKQKGESTDTSNLAKADGLDSEGKNYRLRSGISVKRNVIGSGYIRGYDDMTFRPYNTIRRDEFAVMLDRVFNIQTKNNIYGNYFHDIQYDWSRDAIQRMTAAGIILGYGNGIFNPSGAITKEEALMMISRVVYVDGYDASKGKTSNVEVNKAIAAGLAETISLSNIKAPLNRLEATKLINEVIYKSTTANKYVYFSDVGNNSTSGKVTGDDYNAIMNAAIAR